MGHGFVDDDELLFTSGWEDASDTIWKSRPADRRHAQLLSLDTADTQWYPAGAALAPEEGDELVEIGQVLDIQPQGGGARTMDINPLSKRNGIKMPTGFGHRATR